MRALSSDQYESVHAGHKDVAGGLYLTWASPKVRDDLCSAGSSLILSHAMCSGHIDWHAYMGVMAHFGHRKFVPAAKCFRILQTLLVAEVACECRLLSPQVEKGWYLQVAAGVIMHLVAAHC